MTAEYNVTPHAGVWIETSTTILLKMMSTVTPHAGVWIETWWFKAIGFDNTESPPTRGCGLKLRCCS